LVFFLDIPNFEFLNWYFQKIYARSFDKIPVYTFLGCQKGKLRIINRAPLRSSCYIGLYFKELI
jgi:hypothetical protein